VDDDIKALVDELNAPPPVVVEEKEVPAKPARKAK